MDPETPLELLPDSSGIEVRDARPSAPVEPVEAEPQEPFDDLAATAEIEEEGRAAPRWRRNLSFRFSVTWSVLLLIVAISADWLPIAPPGELLEQARVRPGLRLLEPLGTDGLGRSMLSRVVYGARISLTVGAGAVALGMLIGTMLGLLAGYFRGRVEKVIDYLWDSMMAIPALTLLLALTAVIRPGIRNLTLILAILAVPSMGRVARANTLAFANREFVLAARAMGASHARIIFRELLPNVVLPIMAVGFIAVGSLIVAEGSLSFLGLGIPPPNPSWGGMIAEGRTALGSNPHLVFVPSLMLFLTVFSLNLIGDHLRSLTDARGSQT